MILSSMSVFYSKRSLLIESIYMIQCPGSLIIYIILLLTNFLQSLALEAPVVGSNFLRFSPTLYLSFFSFGNMKTDRVFLRKYNLDVCHFCKHFNVAVAPLSFVSSLLSVGVYTSPLRKIL